MKPRLVQISTSISAHDGMGDTILGIHHEASRLGIESHIYARHTNGRELANLRDLRLTRLKALLNETPDAFVVYHFGIEDRVIDRFFMNSRQKNLFFYYHNVTPEKHIRGWEPLTARRLRSTFKSLPRLLSRPWNLTGASLTNIKELPNPLGNPILPPVMPFASDRFRTKPNSQVIRSKVLTDYPTILFVGRYAPHKRQDLLIEAAKDMLLAGIPCRLILLGKGGGPYVGYLRSLIQVLGLKDHVRMIFDASSDDLKAAYRFASFFTIASEHEGFCIPILEALREGCIPIARPFGAIAELLSGAPTLAADQSRKAFFDLLTRTIRTYGSEAEAFEQLHSSVSGIVDKNLERYLSWSEFLKRCVLKLDSDLTYSGGPFERI